jgi:hypothetical protein
MGVLEAIENGLSNKVNQTHHPYFSDKLMFLWLQARSEDVWQDEDPAYKMLLREVIESRSGSAMGQLPVQNGSISETVVFTTDLSNSCHTHAKREEEAERRRARC